MNPEPPILRSYKSLSRRLRRRFHVPLFFLLMQFSTLVPVVCAVAWMLRDAGWGWLAFLTGVLWFFGSILTSLPVLLSLTARRQNRQESPLPLSFWFTYILPRLLTAMALLVGRVDVAVVVAALFDILEMLIHKDGITASDAALVGRKAAALAAFVYNAVWLFVPLVVYEFLGKLRPLSLLDSLRSKPTRAEYVEQTREACEAGGG